MKQSKLAQHQNTLATIDGIVGPDTWEASFSASASEPEPLPSRSPNTVEGQIRAEKIEAYQSLYEREYEKETNTLKEEPESAETTWVMDDNYDLRGAEEMLKENKDFLIEAAERYGIDGRAIAGAIRWEYEQNFKEIGNTDTIGVKATVYSRSFDEFAYDYFQETGSLDMDYTDYLADLIRDGASNPEPVPIEDFKIQGNGWGKMHYYTAQRVIAASEEEVPDNRTLSTMLAIPSSAIDLIARSMRQAVDAYWDIAKENISDKPEILADLYQSSGYKENYEAKAQEREQAGGNPVAENDMGKWVETNLSSLEDYRTQGSLLA